MTCAPWYKTLPLYRVLSKCVSLANYLELFSVYFARCHTENRLHKARLWHEFHVTVEFEWWMQNSLFVLCWQFLIRCILTLGRWSYNRSLGCHLPLTYSIQPYCWHDINANYSCMAENSLSKWLPSVCMNNQPSVL